AEDMYQKVLKLLTPEDFFIGVAAVSDFKLREPALQKIKKQNRTHLTLDLELSKDILLSIKQQQLAKKVIGFAAETENLLEYARQKLEKKADMIIANDVSGKLGFESVDNTVTIVTPKSEVHFPAARKILIAKQIVEFLKQEL
ncbi:MAG: phosphopantothenoylcysteine decarboxylase / phosphopantothenate---cysteine ligase, partial [Pseudomonadota bacterium]|nr:phosphopantothenoylcysteine decarboxylase / phosphopantothenate---cysteine ligase [Pseudomonadota bacterium]